MSALLATDLVHEYSHWLKAQMIPFERGSLGVLSTPFLDPFNDGIEVSIDSSGGETLLHDNGKTIDNLLDLGIQIDKSERRQSIIQNALAGCGVSFNHGRLQTVVTPSNRAQRMHFLLTAILRLNDLWMTATTRSAGDFFEVVKEFFDQHDILYTANKNVTGRTVEHPIDFIVPLGKGQEKLIKLLPKPSLQTAKVLAFTWADLQDSQPQAQRVVLLNDLLSGSDRLDGETSATKSVSDNVRSILTGYSHQIMSWSESANDEAFVSQVKRAGT